MNKTAMENARPVAQVVAEVLTEIRAPSTKGLPKSTILKRFDRIAQFQTLGDPQLERMFDASRTFAASVNYTEPYWLTLCGKSGTGKTHLAKAIFRQFMEQNRFELKWDKPGQRTFGNTGEFIDWRTFCDSLRSGAFERVDDLCKEWLVILDDVGSERDPTGFIASSLDRILNSRQGKWTLLTTNLSLSEISERLDTRIASRMLRNSGVVIETNTHDFALRSAIVPGTARGQIIS